MIDSAVGLHTLNFSGVRKLSTLKLTVSCIPKYKIFKNALAHVYLAEKQDSTLPSKNQGSQNENLLPS